MTPLPQLDITIHQHTRFAVLAYLARAPGGKASFSVILHDCRIKHAGQLSIHGRVLEDAGLVKIHKTFVDNRPITTLAITAKGRTAFADHKAKLDAMAAPVEVVA
jgi:DNA-binding MarR family transcriptional regulator